MQVERQTIRLGGVHLILPRSGDDFSEQLPPVAHEAHELHVFYRAVVVSPGVDLDAWNEQIGLKSLQGKRVAEAVQALKRQGMSASI